MKKGAQASFTKSIKSEDGATNRTQ